MKDLKDRVQTEFIKVKNRSDFNSLALNSTKMKYVSISSYVSGFPLMKNITVQNFIIPESESLKYLGIVLDRQMKRKEYCENAPNKLREVLYTISNR